MTMGNELSRMLRPTGKSMTTGLDKLSGTVPAAAHVLQVRSLAGYVDLKMHEFVMCDLRRVNCDVKRKVASLRSEMGRHLQTIVKHEEQLATNNAGTRQKGK